MKGTLHKTRNEWTVRYEDYTQPSPLTTREIPLSNSDSQLIPLRGQLPNDQHIMDGMEVDFDVITIDNGDNGVRYAKLTGKGFYREEGSSEIRDKIIADFMNWFIRRYSTSISEGTFGYADSMEREVTLEQMISHYNRETHIEEKGVTKIKKMLLKKLSDDQYVVVDDSKIKLGDWVCFTNKSDVTYKQITQTEVNNSYHGVQKITHSSEPIEEKDRTFMSVTFGWDKIQRLDLSYIKSLFGEVDVVELSKNETKGRVFANGVHEEVVAQMFYRKGYKQCLEDNKDKRFTMQDMLEAYRKGGNAGAAFEAINQHDYNDAKKFEKHEDEKFIASLQPKDTWEVEFIDGQLKLK